MVSRRDFLRSAATGAIALALPQSLFSKTKGTDKPQILQSMKTTLVKWRKSCRESLAGKDYK